MFFYSAHYSYRWSACGSRNFCSRNHERISICIKIEGEERKGRYCIYREGREGHNCAYREERVSTTKDAKDTTVPTAKNAKGATVPNAKGKIIINIFIIGVLIYLK